MSPPRRVGIAWKFLPGDNSTCNDFSMGPDKALYIADTANGKIYKLPAGASTAELFREDSAQLPGIDGIAFLDGTLYVNNVITSKLYRIPVDAARKPGQPVARSVVRSLLSRRTSWPVAGAKGISQQESGG